MKEFLRIGSMRMHEIEKNISNVNTPMGKMEVEMGFENIKVNEGIQDKEFNIAD